MKFLKTESYKKGIIFSTALNILARGIGFLNSLIVAYYFGANGSTDIYFVIISVAMIITTTINSIDFLVLIPESIRLREQENEEASQKFINFFIFSYSIIGGLICLAVILSPTLFYSLFTNFDSDLLLQHKKILYVSGVIIFFQLISNLLNAVLASYKFFTVAILTGLINSLFAIILTVIFHEKLGIEGTIAGLCIGYFINFILLITVLKKYQQWKFSYIGLIHDKTLWTNILLMHLNILPLWIRNAVGLYLLSGLENGLITSINLGQQLSAIPEILIVSQFLSVAGIKFSELFSQKNLTELNVIFLKLCEWGVYITSFIGFGLFLFSSEIIYILYGSSSVGAAGMKNIEIAFCFFIFCLPAKFNAAICTNVLTASQNIRSTFLVTAITHSIVTLLMVFLIIYYGFTGYLIGINIHYYLFLLLFYPIFKKVLPSINYSRVFVLFALNALNNIAAYIAVYYLYKSEILVVNNVYFKLAIGFALYGFLVIIINEFTKANKYFTVKQLYIYGIKTIFS